MHRLSPIPLVLFACTGAPPVVEAPPAPDLVPLRTAMKAHSDAPGPDTLRAVSEAAGAVKDAPLGDVEVDGVLGDALCNHLLRPDLGLERLEAHANSWAGPAAGPWLDCLLRSGDAERFASEVRRLRSHPVDPAIDGLRAAMVQARSHRDIDWRAAVRAHDAGALADAQHARGRKLDRPLPDLGLAFDVFRGSFPDHRVHAVITRSAQAERDDPMRDAGVIPVVGGRRRVFGYAADAEGLADLAAQVKARPPVRTLGLAIEAIAKDGRSALRLCAEGRMEAGQLWLLTACDEVDELSWIEATEHADGAIEGGKDRGDAVAAAAERFLVKVRAN